MSWLSRYILTDFRLWAGTLMSTGVETPVTSLQKSTWGEDGSQYVFRMSLPQLQNSTICVVDGRRPRTPSCSPGTWWETTEIHPLEPDEAPAVYKKLKRISKALPVTEIHLNPCFKYFFLIVFGYFRFTWLYFRPHPLLTQQRTPWPERPQARRQVREVPSSWPKTSKCCGNQVYIAERLGHMTNLDKHVSSWSMSHSRTKITATKLKTSSFHLCSLKEGGGFWERAWMHFLLCFSLF